MPPCGARPSRSSWRLATPRSSTPSPATSPKAPDELASSPSAAWLAGQGARVEDDEVGPSLLADVTFEAVVLVWGGAAANAHGAVPRALGRRIEALCAAGVDVFVVSDVPVEEVDAHL